MAPSSIPSPPFPSSTIQFQLQFLLSAPKPSLFHLPPLHHRRHLLLPRCSTTSSQDSDFSSTDLDSAPGPYELQPPAHKLEKRQKSSVRLPGRPRTALQRPEPPNLEIGWKRTKEIKNEKPKGFVVADFLDKLETLMGRGQYGSMELLVKAGGIVAERAREEAEVVAAEWGEEVDERVVTELFRVLRLLEMDMQMVKVAVKEETIGERIEQARARCRQGIRIALSL